MKTLEEYKNKINEISSKLKNLNASSLTIEFYLNEYIPSVDPRLNQIRQTYKGSSVLKPSFDYFNSNKGRVTLCDIYFLLIYDGSCKVKYDESELLNGIWIDNLATEIKYCFDNADGQGIQGIEFARELQFSPTLQFELYEFLGSFSDYSKLIDKTYEKEKEERGLIGISSRHILKQALVLCIHAEYVRFLTNICNFCENKSN